jgi:carboxypeptidase Taq
MSEVNKGLTESYNGLMERAKDLLTLQSTGAIVYWDLETKMPPRGIQLRSQQLALLQKIGHRMLTDPEIGKLIDAIRGHKDYDSLDQLQKRNVHLTKKEYDEATKLPEELVVETARQTRPRRRRTGRCSSRICRRCTISGSGRRTSSWK